MTMTQHCVSTPTCTPAPMPTPMPARARERMRCALVTFGSASPLAACSVGPNFTRPTPEVPAHWPQPPSETGAAPSIGNEQAAELRDWWSDFNDPTLDSLVSRALNTNLDLRAAVLRIEESRVQRDITAAG